MLFFFFQCMGVTGDLLRKHVDGIIEGVTYPYLYVGLYLVIFIHQLFGIIFVYD